MERSSGILMPLFSLPGQFGCGTAGAEAYRFVDFLADAGQRYWQLLPLCVTGSGDSPYSSPSSFAAEPLLIDPLLLGRQGLLTAAELEQAADLPPESDRCVPWQTLRKQRLPLLRLASQRAWQRFPLRLESYTASAGRWLEEHSLYAALREQQGGRPWYDWPEELRRRDPAALSVYRQVLAEEIRFHIFCQYEFDRQWQILHSYAHSRGVLLIGDLPIYAAPDSADVWAEPQWFDLGDDLRPRSVAGCPPDAFAPAGQRWGNPLYNWEALRNDGYGWWLRRVGRQSELADVLRLDHFRGLSDYWSIPADEEDAARGHWERGPGEHFLRTLTQWFFGLPLIAEDLGLLDAEVHRLRESCGLPGMRVLEFAFTADGSSEYLPHRCPQHCVYYSGTHDNPPLGGWLAETERCDPAQIDFARRYLGLNREEGWINGLLRAGMSSPAELFIAQLQDWLSLGCEARINIPGVPDGNWRWRLDPELFTADAAADLARRIRAMTCTFGRCPA